jgi:hypothetical protein
MVGCHILIVFFGENFIMYLSMLMCLLQMHGRVYSRSMSPGVGSFGADRGPEAMGAIR